MTLGAPTATSWPRPWRRMRAPGAALRKVVLSRPITRRARRAAPPLGRVAPAPDGRAQLHHLLHAGARRRLLRRQPRTAGGPPRRAGRVPSPGRHRAPRRHGAGRRRRPARPGPVGQEPRGAPLRGRRDRRHPRPLLRRARRCPTSPPLVAFRSVAHLGTRIEGRLARPVGVLDLARARCTPRRPSAARRGPRRSAFIASGEAGDRGLLGRAGRMGRRRPATASG